MGAATTMQCDMCDIRSGGERYEPALPALILCPTCRDIFDVELRCFTRGYLAQSTPPGPKPKLTAYRLGALSALFGERGRAKLEHLAHGLR